MKILMVNKFLFPNGGSETYMFKLGEHLTSMGHEVQYFGMEDERNIVSNNAGSYTSKLDFHGRSPANLLYPFKIIYSSEARRKIRAVLDDFRPDIVHLNNFNFQITPSIIYEIAADAIPIVYTAHDYQLVCPNHMLYNIQEESVCTRCLEGSWGNCIKGRCIHGSTTKSILGAAEALLYERLHTYSKITRIICPSHFLATKLAANEDLRGKMVPIHNFIDISDRRACEKDDYVLYFGRYSEEKGIRTLLKVCRELKGINFVFAGNGPLENELQKEPNIRNVGFQTGKQLEELVRRARFTIYPSEWYENCPFSVLESQMYGTPVIGSNIGGIPELIQDGKTGLLFESSNPVSLQETVLMLWYNRSKCDELSQNCLNLSFDTVQSYGEKLVAIYESCLEAPQRANRNIDIPVIG